MGKNGVKASPDKSEQYLFRNSGKCHEMKGMDSGYR